MKPIDIFGYLMQHVAPIMYRQSDQVLQERLGIGMAQFKLLMMLQKYPNVQQREIAERLGQTEASISRQIKLLCDRGMLVIQVNPKNRREHITVPTSKGMKLADAAREVLDEYHTPILEQFNDKQQQQLIDALRVIHEQVCRPGRSHARARPDQESLPPLI